MLDRIQQLQKNFVLMFWIQALLNFKAINVIFTLFYLKRGLSLSQIFYLSIVWSVVAIISEIPSSYMADRWGRKKTLIVGIICALIHWIIMIFATQFWMFIVAIVFLALQFSMFSGTDDALIYDTNKELGAHTDSLKQLGSYYSARSVAKIIAPIIAVLIAKDLSDIQFVIVISISLIAVAIATIISFRLEEPNHYMDVEKQEIGVFKDAFGLIKASPAMIKGMFSRTLIFIASFVIWRYHQELLVNVLHLPVLILGIAWGIHHGCIFLWDRYVTKHFRHHVEQAIDIANAGFFLMSAISLCIMVLAPHPYTLLVSIMFLLFAEHIRWSLYAEFFNRQSYSFNRATTISLANFLKSMLDIPLLFLAAYLVEQNMTYPFMLTASLGLIVLICFRLSPKKQYAS